jgi:hypothetical protein
VGRDANAECAKPQLVGAKFALTEKVSRKVDAGDRKLVCLGVKKVVRLICVLMPWRLSAARRPVMLKADLRHHKPVLQPQKSHCNTPPSPAADTTSTASVLAHHGPIHHSLPTTLTLTALSARNLPPLLLLCTAGHIQVSTTARSRYCRSHTSDPPLGSSHPQAPRIHAIGPGRWMQIKMTSCIPLQF